MVEAFRNALYKRGKPERLYFDNGANYTSKEILQACVRLDIRLSHAPGFNHYFLKSPFQSAIFFNVLSVFV